MRHLIAFSTPATSASTALTSSLRDAAALAADDLLSIAQLPSSKPTWLPSSSFDQHSLFPTTATIVADARTLVARVRANSALELVWLLPSHLPPLNPDGDGGEVDPIGAAVFCARRCAQRAGLPCTCTLVAPDAATARAAEEQWAPLLDASVVTLALEGEDAWLPARRKLAELLDGGRHWAGSLSLHGSLLDGLTFCPLPPSESCDEAVPSSSSAAATSSAASSSSLRWADASEAPIAGSALELVRPVRECELPAHLRLPQVWLVRASMGSRGQAASSFLRGWSEDTKNKNNNAGGSSSTAATDALIVRADGPDGSAPLLLLLYCRGLQVRAQLITPPDSLAGALRFLELKALRGDGEEEEEAVMEEAEEAGTAPQLAWRKALPLERASQLLQQLQKPHDPYDEPPSWDGSVRRALRQVRCVAPQPPADDDDAESRLLREASAAADRADARHRVTSLSDLASSDALANNVPSEMPPPLPKQQGQGGGGSNSRPSATTKASGKRPASAMAASAAQQPASSVPRIVSARPGGSAIGAATAASAGLGGLRRGRGLTGAVGAASFSSSVSSTAVLPGISSSSNVHSALASSSSLGFRMNDALRALRRVRDGAARAPPPAADESDEQPQVVVQPRTTPITAEELQLYQPPQKREHASLLCMLIEPGRLEWSAYSTVRSSSSSTQPPQPQQLPPQQQPQQQAAEPPAATTGPVLAAGLSERAVSALSGGDADAKSAHSLPLLGNGTSSRAASERSGPANNNNSNEVESQVGSNGGGTGSGNGGGLSRRDSLREVGEESATVPSSTNGSVCGSHHSGGLHAHQLPGFANGSAGLQKLIHKTAKQILRETIAPLMDAADNVGGDWTAQLAELEERTRVRLEQRPPPQQPEPQPVLVARMVRTELLAVLGAGLQR